MKYMCSISMSIELTFVIMTGVGSFVEDCGVFWNKIEMR